MKSLSIDESASGAGGGGESFIPKSLRDAIANYRMWILAITALATAIAALWTIRTPKIYKAVTTLEYDPDPTNPLGSEVEGFSDVSRFLMSREFFGTQNLVFQSRAVAERTVENLGLTESPDFFGLDPNEPWTPASVSDAAKVLQGRTTVDPINDTRLIRLAVRDPNPERAAALANAIVQAYIDKTLEDRLGATTAAADWLSQQLGSTRDHLVDAENALHDFKERHNVLSLSLEDRQNLLAQEIQEYNERLTDVRARRIELEARLARLKAFRARPDTIQDGGTKDESELDALRTGLRTKLAERAALSVRYGDAHPQIRELDGEIAMLRKSLAAEVDALVRVAEGDLQEAKAIEEGLSRAQRESQQAGLELNRREIEYSQLNRQRESNAHLYDLLLQRTAEADLTRLLHTTHIRVVDPALVPASPIAPILPLNLAIGALSGLLLGLGFAWFLSSRDRGLKEVADVETLGITVLGTFPKVRDGSSPEKYAGVKRRLRTPERRESNVGALVHTEPMSMAAESCRTLRTNLTFMSVDAPAKTLVVTSADPKDGKTTIVTNLAIAFAQSGQRVLLVDADLRKPRIHEELGLSNERGLTNVLVGEERLVDVAQRTAIDGLSVMTSGPLPPNPAELLHTPNFKSFLAEASRQYDRVIFDSPPLRAVTDAAVLAPQCSSVLLVVRADRTTRDEVLAATRRLNDVRANIVGAVLNDVSVDARKGYGGAYGGYYGYSESNESSSGDDHSQSAA